MCKFNFFSHTGLSHACRGNEVLYDYPSANLSPRVNELKVEACEAYGVLHKV